MTDLDKLEELAKSATPGPWELVDHNDGMCTPRPLWGVINEEFVNPSEDDEAEWLAIEVHVGARPDAEFIALSRDAVPELIADYRATLARIAKVKEVVEAEKHWNEGCGWDVPAGAVLRALTEGENDGDRP